MVWGEVVPEGDFEVEGIYRGIVSGVKGWEGIPVAEWCIVPAR